MYIIPSLLDHQKFNSELLIFREKKPRSSKFYLLLPPVHVIKPSNSSKQGQIIQVLYLYIYCVYFVSFYVYYACFLMGVIISGNKTTKRGKDSLKRVFLFSETEKKAHSLPPNFVFVAPRWNEKMLKKRPSPFPRESEKNSIHNIKINVRKFFKFIR